MDITETINLVVSKGPEPTEPTVNDAALVFDLRGYADSSSCTVKIICNATVVFNQTVAQGTKSVKLEDQTGTGQQKYTIVINGVDSWDEWVDFS